MICNEWPATDVVRKGRPYWLDPLLAPTFDTILPTFLVSNYLMISKRGMKEKILDFMMQYIGSLDLEDKVYLKWGGNFWTFLFFYILLLALFSVTIAEDQVLNSKGVVSVVRLMY